LVTHCQNEPKTATGFTLIELLVVLVIAGFLATLVPPLYAKAVPGVRLKNAARDFAISLRDVRSRAISTGSEIEFKLVADPPSYIIGTAPAVLLPRGVMMTAYDYFNAANGSLADARALKEDDIEIHFYPDGSSNGAVVKVSNSSAAYRVDVSWLLGDVSVREVEENDR